MRQRIDNPGNFIRVGQADLFQNICELSYTQKRCYILQNLPQQCEMICVNPVIGNRLFEYLQQFQMI